MPQGYGYATDLQSRRMPGTGMPPFSNAPFSFNPQQQQQQGANMVQPPQINPQGQQQPGDTYANLLQNPQMLQQLQQQLQGLLQQGGGQQQGGPQNIIPQQQNLGLLSNLFAGNGGVSGIY